MVGWLDISRQGDDQVYDITPYWHLASTKILVNNGSENGLLPDGTNFQAITWTSVDLPSTRSFRHSRVKFNIEYSISRLWLKFSHATTKLSQGRMS